MRALIVGGAAMLMLLASVPIAMPAAPGAASSLVDQVRGEMGQLSGGSMSGSGEIIVWLPDGSSVRHAITTDDFLSVTQYLSDELDHGINAQAADPTAGGVGVGTVAYVNGFYLPDNIPGIGGVLWPFCDAATAYVYYTGSTPQGKAFQQRTSTGQVSPLGSVCPTLGSPFGTAYLWQDVTIDSRLLPSGTTIVRQVGVAQVMAPPPSSGNGRGLVGGYLVGHPVVSAHGSGSAVSMYWTSTYGTLSADMFRGNGAALLIGDNELPLPI